MRWTLNVTNEEPTGVRPITATSAILNVPGDFDPDIFDFHGHEFDAVIFSIPTPELSGLQLDAIDKVLKGRAYA